MSDDPRSGPGRSDDPRPGDELDLHPAAPDPYALKRRVLLTAVVTGALFLTLGAVADATGGGTPMVIGGVILLYVLVMRPMMKPVREALALRRALAYRAWQEQKESDG